MQIYAKNMQKFSKDVKHEIYMQIMQKFALPLLMLKSKFHDSMRFEVWLEAREAQ